MVRKKKQCDSFVSRNTTFLFFPLQPLAYCAVMLLQIVAAQQVNIFYSYLKSKWKKLKLKHLI